MTDETAKKISLFQNPYLDLPENDQVRTTMLLGRHDHNRIKILGGSRGVVQTTVNILIAKLCHELDRIFTPGAYAPGDYQQLIARCSIVLPRDVTFTSPDAISPDALIYSTAEHNPHPNSPFSGGTTPHHGPRNPGAVQGSDSVGGTESHSQPDDKALLADDPRGDEHMAQPTPGMPEPASPTRARKRPKGGKNVPSVKG